LFFHLLGRRRRHRRRRRRRGVFGFCQARRRWLQLQPQQRRSFSAAAIALAGDANPSSTRWDAVSLTVLRYLRRRRRFSLTSYRRRRTPRHRSEHTHFDLPVRNLDGLSVETRGVGHVDAGSGPGQSRTDSCSTHTAVLSCSKAHASYLVVVVALRVVDAVTTDTFTSLLEGTRQLSRRRRRLPRCRRRHYGRLQRSPIAAHTLQVGHRSKHTHFDPLTEPLSALGLRRCLTSSTSSLSTLLASSSSPSSTVSLHSELLSALGTADVGHHVTPSCFLRLDLHRRRAN